MTEGESEPQICDKCRKNMIRQYKGDDGEPCYCSYDCAVDDQAIHSAPARPG